MKRYRYQRLIAQPFPDAWVQVLKTNVAHYSLLAPEERAVLCDDLRIFIEEHYWEGCRGLVITDEHKVTLAAQACLMLLGGEKNDYFSWARSILIYPASFLIPVDGEDERSEWLAVSGQSLSRGPVILSWQTSLQESQNLALRSNLVIHEFAHLLQDERGFVWARPAGESDEECDAWMHGLTAEYDQLVGDLDKGRQTFLGEYAGRDMTEFFAVASEAFFTSPLDLRRLHSSLYSLLMSYYRINPARWFKG